jgi:4-amino-4-deoxy-L-arabinose transferase-like glycosyltransferase
MKAMLPVSLLYNNKMKAIITLAIICLSLRLSFFVAVKPWVPAVRDSVIVTGDAAGYHNLARSIIDHHRFSSEANGTPNAIRTPLYPLFISLFYFLFGPLPWIVLLAQTVLDSMTCLLLYATLKLVSGPKVAFYSALFYAIDPFLILFSVSLMSDILFVFLCVVAFCFITKFLREVTATGGEKEVVFAALFLGLACLVRPIVIYLPVIIALFFMLSIRRQKKRIVLLSAIFLSVFYMTIFPWCMRNYSVFHSFSLSSSEAYNLLCLNVTPMEMERRKSPNFDRVQDSLLLEADNLIRQEGLNSAALNEFQKSTYYRRLAISYIKQRPFTFIKHYSLGMVRSVTNLETSGYADWLRLRDKQNAIEMRAYTNIFDLIRDFFRTKNTGEILIGLSIGFFQVLSYLSLLIGLFLSFRKENRRMYVFLIVIASYFILVTGAGGLARFRLPAIPFYLCFVGAGFAWMLENSDRIKMLFHKFEKFK